MILTPVSQGQNGEVLYEIVHGDQQDQFSIDKRSGLISVGRTLDREMIASYGKSKTFDGILTLQSRVSLILLSSN